MFKTVEFIFPIFFIPAVVLCQSFDEKEFLKALPKAKNDTNKINSLNFYGRFLIQANRFDEALKFSDSAVRLSSRLSFSKGELEALDNLSFVHYSKKEYEKALIYDRKKLAKFVEQKNKTGSAKSNNAIGTLFLKLNQTDSAVSYYKHAVNDYKLCGNKPGIATVSGALGSIYLLLKDYGKALSYSKSAMNIFEELNDKKALADVYKNLIDINNQIGNSVNAADYEEKLNRLNKEIIGNQ